MFLPFSSVWNSPYKRVYFVWGIILLLGFLLPYQDMQWWILTPIGIFFMFYKVPQPIPQVKQIIWLWTAIAAVGTIFTALEWRGIISSFFPIYHFGSYWMLYLGIGQLLTGIIMKNRFQTVLGLVWFVFSIVFWRPSIDPFVVFYMIAALTSLPYLYIAFKK